MSPPVGPYLSAFSTEDATLQTRGGIQHMAGDQQLIGAEQGIGYELMIRCDPKSKEVNERIEAMCDDIVVFDLAEFTTALSQTVGQLEKDQIREIELTEFMNAIKQRILRAQADERLQVQFNSFDKSGPNQDGNGSVTLGEIRNVLRNVGHKDVSDEQIDFIIDRLDKNGDGELNFEEFKSVLEEWSRDTQ